MTSPSSRPRRAGPHPAVLAVSIVLGVLLLVAGPGACAVSCVSAERALTGMVAACNGGLTAECRERVGSEDYAASLADALPHLSANCRATPVFVVRGTSMQVDLPWDMRAELTGKFVAGECSTTDAVVALEGHPLAWRVVNVRPPG